MRCQASLAAHLVNLATPGESQGGVHVPLAGRALRRALSEHLTAHWSAELAAVPKAGARLARVATALRAVFASSDDAEIAARLNRLLRRYRARPYLTNDVEQPFHLHFHGQGRTAVESLGAELAMGLALLMDTYGQKRFGLCEASACDRVYVDLTRNGSRRYCSEGCSDRSKMAAYRKRLADREG